jgi:hypothetical protein
MDAHSIPPIPDTWFAEDRYDVVPGPLSTPCWLWKLSTGRGGYGQVSRRIDGRQISIRAHRIYFERAHGPLNDPTLELHHLCDRPRCVNPAHLQVVTPLEHVRLTPRTTRRLDDQAILLIRASSDSSRTLARRLGVAHSTVQRIRRNEVYTEVVA